MSKVYLALQDNDMSRYIVQAVEEDNPKVTVIYQPAMIRMECENELVVNRATVEEKLGREWEIQELQLSLVTLGGNVEEEEDSLTLSWHQ
ncbi:MULTISPECIES: MmoB/DmpM family protein [unclassified Psychrobacter]|uniref:MmoB/DmpM family protein n=1 Tax=unclassified Psychrobacter TaxID=196806 RepID=UPI00078C4065|nr:MULTISPECIES: MmoB/DmpM family protein [unclassified Psychrobacter]AMN49710.1 monooxygenase [Psychrobacter sp. P2G3]AMN67559.1 monooxygenase [Psychrobacter sp. P11G5]